MRRPRRLKDLTLQIEPTSRCNLDCEICMIHGLDRRPAFMSFDDFKKILDSSGCRFVGVHGWGEPMLNEQLFEMIEYAESGGFLTNLTSNGTLLEKNMDRVFSSGLREIAFGLYDRERFMKVMPGIEELMRERGNRASALPKVYIDVTIYEGNLSQIPDCISLAGDLGVDAVILHRLFNAQKVDPEIKYISEGEEKRLFMDVRRLTKKLGLELYLPPRHKSPCRIVNKCVFVAVDGSVTPCCFLPETSIGSALDQGVEAILRSDAYADFVRNMKEHPVCSRCEW